MKNRLLPIALLGVSGLGLVFASDRARSHVTHFLDRLAESEDPLGDFNQAVENQLENIQRTLDQVAQALEAH